MLMVRKESFNSSEFNCWPSWSKIFSEHIDNNSSTIQGTYVTYLIDMQGVNVT